MPLSPKTSFCTEDGFFVPALPPYDGTRALGGACVLPAFPDAHSHLLAYALSLTQADAAACRTPQDFLRCAERFARGQGLGAGELVVLKNAALLPEDGAVMHGARPLLIQSRSGHAGLCNEAARRLLRLRANVLREREFLAAARRVPLPEGERLRAVFCRAQDVYLSYGVTTAQEGLLSREMFPLYEQLLPALRLDVAAYPAPEDLDEARARFSAQAGARTAAGGSLHIGGVKIFLDGSPQEKTALLREPYAGGGYGTQTMTPAEVRDACRFAADRGAQLLAHCNGDGAAEIFLGALAALPEEARRAIRPVLIHGQILGNDQLDRVKALGVIPSFFSAHVREFGDAHLHNLGRERGMRISPAAAALQRGIPFTLHQDAPVCEPDPLDAAACAVLRTTKAGVTLEEAIAPSDALRAVTKNAAAQYGLSDRGDIAEGLRADFLILEGDPLRDIASARVKETFLRGRCVFSRP